MPDRFAREPNRQLAEDIALSVGAVVAEALLLMRRDPAAGGAEAEAKIEELFASVVGNRKGDIPSTWANLRLLLSGAARMALEILEGEIQ